MIHLIHNGEYYTDMEHYWDESFGYFGASADYNKDWYWHCKYRYNDSNGDGKLIS